MPYHFLGRTVGHPVTYITVRPLSGNIGCSTSTLLSTLLTTSGQTQPPRNQIVFLCFSHRLRSSSSLYFNSVRSRSNLKMCYRVWRFLTLWVGTLSVSHFDPTSNVHRRFFASFHSSNVDFSFSLFYLDVDETRRELYNSVLCCVSI